MKKKLVNIDTGNQIRMLNGALVLFSGFFLYHSKLVTQALCVTILLKHTHGHWNRDVRRNKYIPRTTENIVHDAVKILTVVCVWMMQKKGNFSVDLWYLWNEWNNLTGMLTKSWNNNLMAKASWYFIAGLWNRKYFICTLNEVTGWVTSSVRQDKREFECVCKLSDLKGLTHIKDLYVDCMLKWREENKFSH